MTTTTEGALLAAASVALLLCGLVVLPQLPVQGQLFQLTVDVELDDPDGIFGINASVPPPTLTLNGTVRVERKPPVDVTVTLQVEVTTGWSVVTDPATMTFTSPGTQAFSVVVTIPDDPEELNATQQAGVTITAVARAGALDASDTVTGTIVITKAPHEPIAPPVGPKLDEARRQSQVLLVAVAAVVGVVALLLVLWQRGSLGPAAAQVGRALRWRRDAGSGRRGPRRHRRAPRRSSFGPGSDQDD